MDDMNVAQRIVADAWDAFDRWCMEHDLDGELDHLERIEAYGKWCDDQDGLKPMNQ